MAKKMIHVRLQSVYLSGPIDGITQELLSYKEKYKEFSNLAIEQENVPYEDYQEHVLYGDRLETDEEESARKLKEKNQKMELEKRERDTLQKLMNKYKVTT